MTKNVVELQSTAPEALADSLNQCVADTVVATMLAQNFHWNVTGMAFGPLHELFQSIYEDHFAAQDDLAERIRALEAHVDATLAGMIARSKVAEHDGHADAATMIKTMCVAEETLAATLAAAGNLAAENGDPLTEDLCIERGREHEKFAWMLRAHVS